MGDQPAGIALIGMRRSGKSTVGRALAEALSLPFCDLDQAVESHTGRSVADILLEEGQPAFRKVESEVLEEVVARGSLVLACGGGTPLQAANRERLQSFGRTLYLRVGHDELQTRMQSDADPSTRPALLDDVGPDEEIRRLLEERDPLYRSCADDVIDAESDVKTVVERALRALRAI